jgi:tetratricopeptide (TPR) repeat protein
VAVVLKFRSVLPLRLSGLTFLWLSVLGLAPPGLAAPAAAGEIAAASSTLEASAREAAYQFALAKLLLGEGSTRQAVEAFERAAELAPDEPYVHLELADVLAELAQSQRDPAARQLRLHEAIEQIDRARELAPDNLDVLRSVSRLYLGLSDRDPQALTTALEALESIRRREPWDLQTMVTLGQIYMARGKAAQGAEVFAEAVRHTPDNRILYGFLADASERAGKDLQAEEALEKILALDPLDVETRIRVAELKSRRQAHDEALAVLTAAPEGVGDEERLRFLEARELLLTGEPEKALQILDALRGEDLSNRLRFFLADLRGRALARLDRDDEAAEEIRSLLELDPASSDTVRNVASQLVQLGREDEAVAALAGFIESHDATPGEASVEEPRAPAPEAEAAEDQRQAVETARLALAALYVEREQWDEAVAVLAPLLGSESSDSRLTGAVNSAEVLYQAGRLDDALELLRKSQATEPLAAGKRTELLLRAGEEGRARRLLRSLERSGGPEETLAAVRAFHSQQRYEETVPVLGALAAEHPSVEIYFLLGAAEERTGDTPGAAATFLRLLEMQPDHAPALNYLGYMWADRGENLERALEMVEKAVEIDPHNGAYIDSLGWIQYRLGKYAEAREHLEEAARLVPGDPVVYEHLGDVYTALGERGKAAEFYRRALQVAAEAGDQDVDLKMVRRKLEQLSDP